MRSRLTALAAALVLMGSVLLGVFVAAPASAHDYLVASSPQADSTVTAPLHSVDLTFDDVVLDLNTSGPSALLTVTGPDGAARHFETGCPTVSGRDVTAPVDLGGPGKYLVTWQIVSADGHVVSDSIQFAYQPPAGTKEAAGASADPCKGYGAAASTAPKAGQGTAQGTVDPNAVVIVVAIAVVIVVLALAAVLIIVLTRRRAPRH
jgi:methionine-rich copper-binding protein CopC